MSEKVYSELVDAQSTILCVLHNWSCQEANCKAKTDPWDTLSAFVEGVDGRTPTGILNRMVARMCELVGKLVRKRAPGSRGSRVMMQEPADTSESQRRLSIVERARMKRTRRAQSQSLDGDRRRSTLLMPPVSGPGFTVSAFVARRRAKKQTREQLREEKRLSELVKGAKLWVFLRNGWVHGTFEGRGAEDCFLVRYVLRGLHFIPEH